MVLRVRTCESRTRKQQHNLKYKVSVIIWVSVQRICMAMMWLLYANEVYAV